MATRNTRLIQIHINITTGEFYTVSIDGTIAAVIGGKERLIPYHKDYHRADLTAGEITYLENVVDTIVGRIETDEPLT